MIELQVKPYCQECGEFEPEVVKCEHTCMSDTIPRFNTVIYCEHQGRCERLMERLKEVNDNG